MIFKRLPMRKRLAPSFVAVLLLSFAFISASAQSPYTSVAGGAWNLDATWSGTGIPAAGDVVTIANGHNVRVTATAACTTLNINDGGTLTLEGGALTVSGTTTVGQGTSGIVTTANAATGLKTFTGPVILNAGASWNLTGQNPSTSFGGGITMGGSTFNN